MVTHNPEDGHPPSPGWSLIIPRLVNHYKNMVALHPKACHPSSKGWSPTIPSMGTHHLKMMKFNKANECQLNMEFNTSADRLVNSYLWPLIYSAHHDYLEFYIRVIFHCY